jgi:hypothetical protein
MEKVDYSKLTKKELLEVVKELIETIDALQENKTK